MKKFVIICTAALMVFSVAANAQDKKAERNYGPYTTCGAASNWFISLGGGIDWVSGAAYGESNAGKVTPTLDFSFGKWVLPTVGARIGYQGWKASANDQKVACDYLHADLLWNVSTQFLGYKVDRIYNCIPYAHVGMFCEPNNLAFGAGFGLLNNFRINDRFVVFADLRANAAPATQFKGDCGAVCQLDLSLGLTVNLGKNLTFESNQAADPKALADAEAALAAAKQTAEDAQKEAEAAKKDAAAAQDEAAASKKAAEDAAAAQKAAEDKLAALKDKGQAVVADTVGRILAGPLAVYFEIGKTTLSEMENQHLTFYLDNILKGDAKDNMNFILTGSADKGTGSPERNAQLCEERVATVKSILMDKYGVSEDKIAVKDAISCEDTEHPQFGRAVIIEH